MSTIKKLGGGQYKSLREKRQQALNFFAVQSRQPPPIGMIAAAVLQTLTKIHKDPTLNGLEKDRQFRRVVQAAHRAGKPPDVAPVPGVQEAEVGRDIPAGSGSDELAAP